MIHSPKSAHLLTSLFLLFLLSSCASPAPVDVPTPTVPASSATSIATTAPHAAEIHFALVGNVTSPNVWALFDSQGYSYNNYAVRSAYWPRLYHLAIPGGNFEPQAAASMPSPVQQEGAFYTATVPLRADLKWTDGSSFTADDVAFTANTAVSFQLGFDWHAYYDPSFLDHAEALDPHTVKFFFKKAPNIAVWQYGALLGPVVQKAYWAGKLISAASVLPTSNQLALIESFETQVAAQQKSINDLIARGAIASGDEARQLQIELQNQQRNLDGLRNALARAHEAVDGDMDSARQALYSVEASGEPVLGTWLPAGQSGGTWTNSANPSHPFSLPNFDRAVYIAYPDEASAVAALKDGKVNAILESGGLPPGLVSGFDIALRVVLNRSASAQFIAINSARGPLQDNFLRQAMYCAIDRGSLGDPARVTSLDSPVIPDAGRWSNSQITTTCGEGVGPGWRKAVAILKTGGYAWSEEPSDQAPGKGLMSATGERLAAITLLAAPEQADGQTSREAQQVQVSLSYIGLTVNVQPASPAAIRFALFNSHNYDMAIVGWRLSAYPGYLCDWFGDGNPFGYNIPQARSDCAQLSTTTDLDRASQIIFDIQYVLSQDPPFIPLVTGITYDATRGIRYPFEHVINGLSSVYGAPELAIPASP